MSAAGAAPSFVADIKPRFRERDQSSMLQGFDLWSFDDVKANADAILDAVRTGSMPCDGPWPTEKSICSRAGSTVACGAREMKEALPG